MVFLDLPGSGHHGGQRIGNLVDGFREKFLGKDGPGGTAGGKQERQFPRGDFLHIVLRLCHGSHIRADCRFVHIIKAKLLQGRLDLIRRGIFPKLPYKGGGYLGNDLPARLHGPYKLENLGFIRNSAKGAAHHTLAAGNTQIRINVSPALFVTLNGIHSAMSQTGANLMGNRIIRADGFTFPASNALLLVDHGFSLLHTDGPSGTDLPAGMGHTPHTFIRNLIFIFRTGIAGRRDHLHQRRFIIFLIDIALFQPLGHMHRRIFRTQREPHRQPDPLSYDCPLPVNAFIFRFIIVNNLIGQSLHVILQIVGGICQICHFFKNASSDFTYLCIYSSHHEPSPSEQSLLFRIIFTHLCREIKPKSSPGRFP